MPPASRRNDGDLDGFGYQAVAFQTLEKRINVSSCREFVNAELGHQAFDQLAAVGPFDEATPERRGGRIQGEGSGTRFENNDLSIMVVPLDTACPEPTSTCFSWCHVAVSYSGTPINCPRTGTLCSLETMLAAEPLRHHQNVRNDLYCSDGMPR